MSVNRADEFVRIGRIEPECEVLGPGRRGVLWVAGCPLRCRECVTPELLDSGSGSTMSVDEVVEQLLSADPDGVTFSGGEPFFQAGALVAVSDCLRRARPDISLMSFSGFTLAWLQRRGSADQRALLARLDILVDGPYVAARHAALRWRGSSNQQIRLLTDRHPELRNALDTPAGLVIELTDRLEFQFTGVPPVRGFRPQLVEALADQGLREPKTR